MFAAALLGHVLSARGQQAAERFVRGATSELDMQGAADLLWAWAATGQLTDELWSNLTQRYSSLLRTSG